LASPPSGGFCRSTAPSIDLGIVTVGIETEELGNGAKQLVLAAERAVRDCR
jgi:hypothetical protein